jgi:hypothetical protein
LSTDALAPRGLLWVGLIFKWWHLLKTNSPLALISWENKV